MLVVVCGQRLAHLPHALNRSALQRRTACDFNIPAPVPVRRFAVTLCPFPSTVFSVVCEGLCDAHRITCLVAANFRLTTVSCWVGTADHSIWVNGAVQVEMSRAGVKSHAGRAQSLLRPRPRAGYAVHRRRWRGRCWQRFSGRRRSAISRVGAAFRDLPRARSPIPGVGPIGQPTPPLGRTLVADT